MGTALVDRLQRPRPLLTPPIDEPGKPRETDVYAGEAGEKANAEDAVMPAAPKQSFTLPYVLCGVILTLAVVVAGLLINLGEYREKVNNQQSQINELKSSYQELSKQYNRIERMYTYKFGRMDEDDANPPSGPVPRRR